MRKRGSIYYTIMNIVFDVIYCIIQYRSLYPPCCSSGSLSLTLIKISAHFTRTGGSRERERERGWESQFSPISSLVSSKGMHVSQMHAGLRGPTARVSLSKQRAAPYSVKKFHWARPLLGSPAPCVFDVSADSSPAEDEPKGHQEDGPPFFIPLLPIRWRPCAIVAKPHRHIGRCSLTS